MNETTILALNKGLGLADEGSRFRDLDALAGTWQPDPKFDAAIAAHEPVDSRLDRVLL